MGVKKVTNKFTFYNTIRDTYINRNKNMVLNVSILPPSTHNIKV